MNISGKKYLQSPDQEQGVCPAFLALGLIANKWSVKILYTLAHAKDRPLRFGEIQKSLQTITQRELTKHLREFEKSGLIKRTAYAEVPPRVEYELTSLGYSLKEPVDALSEWSQKYGDEIMKHREAYTQ
ncbi:MAG: helix-turn-helix transcriptional regulator [Alphaproteobacteria bacterium]|nr:helix-turn-helix transcriptional regulator [Alphaproteobacteria bacterium]